MSPNSLSQTIAGLFTERLDLEVPTPDTDLFDVGLLDSLKLVELIVCLEDRFQTRVAPEDLEIDNFRSIDRIAQFVADHGGLAVAQV